MVKNGLMSQHLFFHFPTSLGVSGRASGPRDFWCNDNTHTELPVPTLANSPSFEAAALRTMGVSSLHSCWKCWRSSALMAEDVRGYATEKRPQAEVRDVNQSPGKGVIRWLEKLYGAYKIAK